MKAFRAQFSQLDFNPQAELILQKSLDVGGPFDSAEVLNTKFGSELLRTFSDITPSSVLSLFNRRLAGLGVDQLLEIKEGRREIVWTLEKLAFRAEYFDHSAYLLMRLGIAENETFSNNATGQFLSLFPILLASTEVDLGRRLDLLQQHSKNPENIPIILRAIKSALKTSDFIYFRGSEKIGRVSKTNYEPTGEEVHSYFAGCLELLLQIGSQNGESLTKAADILKDVFIGLCRAGFSSLALANARKVASLLENDWDGMYDTLALFEDSVVPILQPEDQTGYKSLLKDLKKDDIVSRFRRIEKDHTHNWKESVERSIEMQREEYEALANDTISGKKYDKATLEKLMRLQPSFSAPFGQTLAIKSDTETKTTILNDCIDLTNTIENLNPQILHDFIAGLSDEEYRVNLPLIITLKNHRLLFGVVGNRGLSKTNLGLQMIEELVKQSKANSSNFINLYINLPLQNLKSNEVIAWLKRIVKFRDGLETVFEIGLRIVMFKSEISNETIDFLKETIIENKDNPSIKDCQSFWSVIYYILDLTNDSELAKVVTEILLEKITSPEMIFGQNYVFQELVQVLMSKYFTISWPLISAAMINEATNISLEYNLRHLLFDQFKNESLIDIRAHKDDLLAFCDRNPTKAPQIVMAITEWNGTDGGFSELTRLLIDKFGDNQAMLQELSCQMNTLVSQGSIIPHYHQRKSICESLISHPNPNVAKWASREVANYEHQILVNKNFEEEQF